MFKLTPRLMLLLILVLSSSVTAQNTDSKPAWNVTLESNKTARSNITVQNRCKKTHDFQIEPQGVPFLEISQTQVKVKGGKNTDVPVKFNTADLLPKIYEGQVLVICRSCGKEPTCSQDREILPVILTVTGDSPPSVPETNNNKAASETAISTDEEKNPCEVIETSCEDLRKLANEKESIAAGARDAAEKAREPADAAEKAAKEAESAADNAARLANIKPPTGRGSIDGGPEYTTADSAYLRIMNAQVNADLKAGKISTQEHQKRLNENDLAKAKKERESNEASLKKAAEEAKKKAEAARKAADGAKKVADAAQKVADDAKAAADAARKAWEECAKKLAEECRKLKEAKFKAEAEEARLAAESKRSAAAAARLKAKQEEAQKRAEENRLKRQKENEYLVDNIKKLGLIKSRVFDEVPSAWQWLPEFLQTPVSMLVEERMKIPIPLDTIKAIGGLYGIAASLLDPCTALGSRKTVERLEEMTNPKTGRKYTLNEALDKNNRMCSFLRKLKAKLEELKAHQK